MVFGISCQSGISLPTSGALLTFPYPTTSASLPQQSNRALIQANLCVSSNCLRSRKELQLNWAGNFNRVALVCQPRRRIERRAGTFGSRLPIRVSSMPPVIGSASIYPIKGIFYFLRGENRLYLWKRVAAFAAEVGAATVAIFGTLVGFTFNPQRHLLLQVVPHFFGTPGTIALILVETAIPVVLLFYNRMNRMQEKLFDDVLRFENVEVERSSPEEREWIDEQREIQWRQRSQDTGSPGILRTLANPSAMNDRPIMKYIITLPLNFVPVAGTAAFCWVNSMDISTSLHHHYYSKLKGLSAEEEATVVYNRRKQYQQFGLMATALTLLPGFDVILVLTNSIGAALWAVDIEKNRHRQR